MDTKSFEREKEPLEVVVEVRLDLVAPTGNLTLKKTFEFAVR